MVTIRTFTVSEWHTSSGAKGQVFVRLANGVEVPIHQASEQAMLVDEEWTDVQGGKHGKWVESTYDVADGTILKLWSASTYRGVTSDGGGAYLVVSEAEPRRYVAGSGYGQREGSVSGSVRLITVSGLVELGVTLDPKLKKYYRDGLVTAKEVKEEAHGDTQHSEPA